MIVKSCHFSPPAGADAIRRPTITAGVRDERVGDPDSTGLATDVGHPRTRYLLWRLSRLLTTGRHHARANVETTTARRHSSRCRGPEA